MWSAGHLATDEGRAAIEEAHFAFLQAHSAPHELTHYGNTLSLARNYEQCGSTHILTIKCPSHSTLRQGSSQLHNHRPTRSPHA